MLTSRLRDLAKSYGIESSYIDAAGKKQHASRDALVAAIEKRAGVPVGEAAERRSEEPVLEPVVVLWGNDRTVDVNLPGGTEVEWDLALEDGSFRSGRIDVLGGTITLDAPLPHGYHSLTIDGEHEALVIAAPKTAHAPEGKTWGLFVPLHSARTRRTSGTGDLGDLLAYASWIDHHGGEIVATLPMLAAFDDDASPYSPVSRLFWNELYLDVTRLPEFREGEIDEEAAAHLRQARDVDYAGAHAAKRRLLETCAARFTADAGFEKFAIRASDYAEFRASREGSVDAMRYHLYVQYRMAQQMRDVANTTRRLGAGLYLDYPLGANPEGYDAHRYAHVFAKDVSVGAPPDLFFTKGQNWGFAPFDPDAVRRDRYSYFRDAIRQHVSHAGILRLDHVMGLHRLYWIPEGAEATDGVYVRYRAEETYAILTLESRRHRCTIVGEDLGTVPPEVPKMMNRHGLRRMYVVQYEVKPEDPPLTAPSRASIASINTHDMPTFSSFWNANDVDARVEQGLLDDRSAAKERESREEVRRALVHYLLGSASLTSGPTRDPRTVLDALLRFLASSDAEMMLVNPEDLWGELEPQNMPGVPDRSWRHRFRMTLEEAQADGSIRRTIEDVNRRRVD